jgi:glucose dehydrogenase
LVAWDVVKQKEAWRVQGGGSIGGGTVTTAGNLVLQSLGNGRLRALSADKGDQLIEIATGQTGGMGPPITFMLDNKQYVAVAGGQGSNQGGRGGNAAPPTNPVLPRVYVYALDGSLPNPTPAPPAPAAPAGARGQ